MLFISNPVDKKKIDKIVIDLKKHLFRYRPWDIRNLSYFILALDRFPLAITNLVGSATFTTPVTDGNYAWVDIEFSENSFTLNRGEFFSDGYYETHNLYEANYTDTPPYGDIDEWLTYANLIFPQCTIDINFLSDDNDIDWNETYSDPDIDEKQVKEQLSYLKMLGVAATYYHWTKDPNFDQERAVQFKRMANSILLIANKVGPAWDPPAPSEISLLGFLGQQVTGD